MAVFFSLHERLAAKENTLKSKLNKKEHSDYGFFLAKGQGGERQERRDCPYPLSDGHIHNYTIWVIFRMLGIAHT